MSDEAIDLGDGWTLSDVGPVQPGEDVPEFVTKFVENEIKLFDVTLRRTYTEKGQSIWPDAKRKPEQDSSHPQWAMNEQEVWDYWAEIHGKPYPYWDEKYKDSVAAVVEVSAEDLAERRSKAWNYRFGGVCCELAVFSPCVCSYKTVCPVHGSQCHGTHD